MSVSALPACRLCLITPGVIDPASFPDLLEAALAGGDVASLVIAPDEGAPARQQRVAELLVPIAQRAGVAALIRNDTRIAGRVGADGVHVDAGLDALRAAAETLRPKRIVGAGGLRSRDDAMRAGEVEPDYLFFGRPDGDDGDDIHPKALELAAWWAELFEIPAMVMGGRRIDSVAAAASAGIEFAALRAAVFDHADPAAAVAEANRVLAGLGAPA